LCVSSYINAYSLTESFLPSLDFNQSLAISGSVLAPITSPPDGGANTHFSFRDGPSTPGSVEDYSEFYGSISTLSINAQPVPEPLSFIFLGTGVAALVARQWWTRQA
jgi:hypothetical protein